MTPKACQDYCIHYKKCPEPQVQSFVDQLEQAQHRLVKTDLESICWSFMEDPTDDEEFIINIWGI